MRRLSMRGKYVAGNTQRMRAAMTTRQTNTAYHTSVPRE